MSRKSEAEKIFDEFENTKPKHAAAHMDGKMLMDNLGLTNERLAILVFGPPHHTEGKILSIPSIEDGTGRIIANAVYESWLEWGVANNVRAIVFDTTACNTKVHKGSVTLLEKKLQHKILWLACRHHVAERIISDVWKLLFGPNYGPDNKHFVDFRKSWISFDLQKPSHPLTIDSQWLHLQKEVVTFLEDFLKGSIVLPRDDY